MEQVLTEDVSGPESGREVQEHVAVVKAEDVPPNAGELTPEQRAILDTALRALFEKHAMEGSAEILGNPRLGYCEKILELYGLHLWTWLPDANALLADAMRSLPPYLHIYIQRKAQKLVIDCFTAG